ncbi:MAG: T9SS C-terminal target domain-containing protein [Candidatus Kapaibacterium sp.]|nr:MAG: T9SS C-terminal target domain-containing protein [Candidatus Kapabacteria bacterium]
MKNSMKLLFLLLCCIASFAPANAQRNVILIIADDLGTDYLGFYEDRADTAPMPNIRKLLARGVRFQNTMSAPLCSPTRAGILTGRYGFRTGVGAVVEMGTVGSLDTAEMTIPRLLNLFAPSGIAKANIGKWHLQSPMPTSNLIFPNRMGYDHYAGNFSGQLASYTNWSKVTNGVSSTSTAYATTETANDAISWIKAQNAKPFFLWLAFNAPHTPFHLPPTNLHSYKTLSGSTADIQANPKSYFKASLEALDTEIGRLMDSLQALKKLDSTDIIFIGDNGNTQSVAQITTRNRAKGTIYQYGVKVPFIIAGPSVINPNRVSAALVNTVDIFATVLELFGFGAWQTRISASKPVDSKSLLPIIQNRATEVRPWAFTEIFSITPDLTNDGKTIRNAAYKLIRFDNGNQEFYNLLTDPNEASNLFLRTLSATERANYNYLCGELSTLTGTTVCNTALSVEETRADDVPRIAPNPASTVLRVSWNDTLPFSYKFTSIDGKVVKEGLSLQDIDVANVARGAYFLTVSKENKTFVEKILIRK